MTLPEAVAVAVQRSTSTGDKAQSASRQVSDLIREVLKNYQRLLTAGREPVGDSTRE